MTSTRELVKLSLEIEGYEDEYTEFLTGKACELIDTFEITTEMIEEVEKFQCIGTAFDKIIISAIKQELLDRLIEDMENDTQGESSSKGNA